ncbi:hypothetical protein TrVE_jg4704 [Triparma verrucosa]|uniref:Uncharacterized protein n=1 Tax=Triparma verrucosa TaxID=1606542 RepID=A0A9W7F2R1_9STRA|nr:hypothetical protein TrVE_jg4704 [Triparma verrucosa]
MNVTISEEGSVKAWKKRRRTSSPLLLPCTILTPPSLPSTVHYILNKYGTSRQMSSNSLLKRLKNLGGHGTLSSIPNLKITPSTIQSYVSIPPTPSFLLQSTPHGTPTGYIRQSSSLTPLSSLYRSPTLLPPGTYEVTVKEIDGEGDNGMPLVTFSSSIFEYKQIKRDEDCEASEMIYNLADLKIGQLLPCVIKKVTPKFYHCSCSVSRLSSGGKRVPKHGIMYRDTVEDVTEHFTLDDLIEEEEEEGGGEEEGEDMFEGLGEEERMEAIKNMLDLGEFNVGDEVNVYVETVSKQSGRFTVSLEKPEKRSKEERKIEKLKEEGVYEIVEGNLGEGVEGEVVGKGGGGGYVKDGRLGVVGRVGGEVGEVGSVWRGKVKGIEGGEVWFV